MKYKIIPNMKIIKCFFLVINLKIKPAVLVFAMIICGKTKLVKYYEGEESKLDRHRRIA